MTPIKFKTEALEPAYDILPPNMRSQKATVMVLAICLQESRFKHRYQIVQGRPGVKGPARGFAQFELGTEKSRGGVWGVYLHYASRPHLKVVCEKLGIKFEPRAIWEALETNDVLAAAVARLLLYTDPHSLPELGSAGAAWNLYIRTWRPGKPHPQTWAGLYAQALEASK